VRRLHLERLDLQQAEKREPILPYALANLRDGDVMVMHTGIWSRKEPFAPMLDPLLAGLKAKGFCFATVTREIARAKAGHR
jgi:hypothetical protein